MLKTIRTKNDLTQYRRQQTVPLPLLHHLEDYFLKLWQNLSDGEPLETFSLEKHGPIYLLEPTDNVRNLTELNPEDGGLIGSAPESVDLVTLSDGSTIFRILILCNNDYGVIFFSVPDTFDEEVEAWLREQAGLN